MCVLVRYLSNEGILPAGELQVAGQDAYGWHYIRGILHGDDLYAVIPDAVTHAPVTDLSAATTVYPLEDLDDCRTRA